MKTAHGYYLDIDGQEVGKVTRYDQGNHTSIYDAINGCLFDGHMCDPKSTQTMIAQKTYLDTLASLYGGNAKVVAFGYYKMYEPDGITRLA